MLWKDVGRKLFISCKILSRVKIYILNLLFVLFLNIDKRANDFHTIFSGVTLLKSLLVLPW